MKIEDPGKFLCLALAVVMGGSLAIVAAITHDAAGLTAGSAMVTVALGYLTGNGRLARRGKPSVPTFSTTRTTPQHPASSTSTPVDLSPDTAQLVELDETEGDDE